MFYTKLKKVKAVFSTLIFHSFNAHWCWEVSLLRNFKTWMKNCLHSFLRDFMRKTTCSPIQSKALIFTFSFLRFLKRWTEFFPVIVLRLVAVPVKPWWVSPKAMLGFWKEAATWFVVEVNFHSLSYQNEIRLICLQAKNYRQVTTFILSKTLRHKVYQKTFKLFKIRSLSIQFRNWLNINCDCFALRRNSTRQNKFADSSWIVVLNF